MPVFWLPAPAPLRAQLIFRVGCRDETFRTSGITHLVEHLAMHAIGRRHHEHDAYVEPGRTTFEAAGSEPAVADFVQSICRALGGLPTDRLPVEKSILRREESSCAHPLAGAALSLRYGARDLGLLGYVQPALDTISAADVQGWTARHFTAANVALTLTGPPSPDLRLPLPRGERNVRRPVDHLPVRLPGWTDGEVPGAAVAVLVDQNTAAMAATRIAVQRAQDELRHRRGISYVVDFAAHAVDADRGHVTFLAETAPQSAADAAEALLSVLEDIALRGPTQGELALDRAGLTEHLRDPRSVQAVLLDAVAAEFGGRRMTSPAALLAEHEALTPAAVADAVSGAVDTAIVVLPPDVEPRRQSLPRIDPPAGEPIEGRRLARRFRSLVPRGASLVVGDAALSVRLPNEMRTIRYDEVVGVGVQPDGTHLVLGADGTTLPVAAQDWRHGDVVVAALRERVPGELFFVDQPDEAEDRAG